MTYRPITIKTLQQGFTTWQHGLDPVVQGLGTLLQRSDPPLQGFITLLQGVEALSPEV